MIIGLTGQIGSGKSTAANILKKMGCSVIDADLIGRQVVETNKQVRTKLVKEFSSSIIDKNKKIKRKKLAELAFHNLESRDKLNKIVHPYLLKELRKQLSQLKKRNKCVVIDAALLLHWKMQKEVDFVLVIHAGRDIRLRRLEERGISRKDALARERSQISFSKFREEADRLIYNNKDLSNMERKLKKEFHNAIDKF